MFTRIILFITFIIIQNYASGQSQSVIQGTVISKSLQNIAKARIQSKKNSAAIWSNSDGTFFKHTLGDTLLFLTITKSGFVGLDTLIRITSDTVKLLLELKTKELELSEVVISAHLRETGKDDSPLNIDILTPKFLQKTNTPNLLEATAFVNGVRPQINCNVCNTGDIHINGMEGPYTLVLIDGMPIVSGLSTVYGLSGIPVGIIERIEVSKGPSASLYGSEAMGGVINVITKKTGLAPKIYADYYSSSYSEHNLELSSKINTSKLDNLIGMSGHYFNKIYDINNDGFTDIALQKRISLFNKLSIHRANQKEFSIAGRLFYENRWGGQTHWTSEFKGSDSIYGENSITHRAEIIGKYEWQTKENITTQFSYNTHSQKSYYGEVQFDALQNTGFVQTFWNKPINSKNDFILGSTYKYMFYDDNSIVTQKSTFENKPEITHLFGLFAQNESTLDNESKHKIIFGSRVDYHPVYKFIPSPRLAYKWMPDYRNILRINIGTGFRIVQVFTEDHAALTGAREVVFVEEIKPEKSYNATLNYTFKMPLLSKHILVMEYSLFHYYFTNKIIPNYDEDPHKIIYKNLNGYSYTNGGAVNFHLISNANLSFNIGITYTDVQNINSDSLGRLEKTWQINSPKWSGNFVVGYKIPKINTRLDVSGVYAGPQRLVILPNDFRPEYSPWYCLLNVQLVKEFEKNWELYAGLKNILNFIPKHPLMRPHDPFDKTSQDPVANPNGYTFDTGYNYAPIQGIRFYAGIRITI